MNSYVQTIGQWHLHSQDVHHGRTSIGPKSECSKNGDDADRHKERRRAHVNMHQQASIAQHVVPVHDVCTTVHIAYDGGIKEDPV